MAKKKKEKYIVYSDYSNQDYFEEKGKSFYMSEVKFGLSDNEYMYQVHIIN